MSAGPLGNALPGSPTSRVAAAYRRIAEVDRPEVWITLRPEADVAADAAAVEQRLSAGAALPLAGLLIAVKDNVDVAGLPTTAACPAFAYTPDVTAAAVERLIAAGAIVLGKTNLDQFATGLVGTRSPYGPVRNAFDPELVSGGSSSGSAVAVALGIADIGIGTDTAGSGRVPAALQGIVGIKATLGVVPAHGVVPACADFDAVTVFAADLERAVAAAAIMAGPDARDPRSRKRPADVLLSAPRQPRLAVPRTEDLTALSAPYAAAFSRTVAGLADSGISVTEIDIAALLDAALLLYDGAIVAERYAAVGEFLSAAPPDTLDPTVAAIIRAAEHTTGPGFATDLDTLATARAAAKTLLDGYDGLLLPTTTEHPAIAAVQAEPVAINRRMGTFTNFCNLLDMAAVAVPGSPTADGSPFGVMVVVPAFADQVAIDIAARLVGTDSTPALFGHDAELAVFGAHLRGQPLHWQLEQIGARFLGEIRTTDAYRLTALDTTPPKPGLVRHGQGQGAPIVGELFGLSAAGLGSFLAALPAPMALANIELEDGRTVVGFACTYDAAVAATDITEFGGWKKYLEQLS
ncbi:allophanate hydrolase [Nocardia cyriacigeorgica]|uniref:allophanate hydrolase n=1 Tax=Nocardia cyriacigeorgica TaxID=135487 RepID=UPI0018938653|nr:allophanate hydrolase [Nocardia cyriacigeorgica]MBF6453672.1 allophanate hydrolase [Nocardia cyriacigeorgica]MBF6479645.1 allophanate hydrolase [Nocardia cyriacigeorgica]MBF6550840.1 allophanate hydrolase [Nocardia cyriacigeorgica]